MRCCAMMLAVVLLVSVQPGGASAQTIMLNQVDTFESGTTLNWAIGVAGFTGPTVVAGGPTGNFLQLISGTFPAPPRWTIFNTVQWTGNYNATTPNPVNGIQMDIANFSATVAAMRIAIKPGPGMTAGYTFIGGSGTNGAHDIPNDGVFRTYVFPIDSSTMAPISDPMGNPPAPLATLLNSVGELRILESPTAQLNGQTAFTGRIGIDNIRAIFIVPEPTGILGACAIAVGVASVIRRRRRIRGQPV
jgi:hypothetical protein